jgi:hypothetical protein
MSETTPRDGTALERFERFTAIPMLVLAVAFIPLLIIPNVVQLSPDWETTVLASTGSFGRLSRSST